MRSDVAGVPSDWFPQIRTMRVQVGFRSRHGNNFGKSSVEGCVELAVPSADQEPEPARLARSMRRLRAMPGRARVRLHLRHQRALSGRYLQHRYIGYARSRRPAPGGGATGPAWLVPAVVCWLWLGSRARNYAGLVRRRLRPLTVVLARICTRSLASRRMNSLMTQ